MHSYCGKNHLSGMAAPPSRHLSGPALPFRRNRNSLDGGPCLRGMTGPAAAGSGGEAMARGSTAAGNASKGAAGNPLIASCPFSSLIDEPLGEADLRIWAWIWIRLRMRVLLLQKKCSGCRVCPRGANVGGSAAIAAGEGMRQAGSGSGYAAGSAIVSAQWPRACWDLAGEGGGGGGYLRVRHSVGRRKMDWWVRHSYTPLGQRRERANGAAVGLLRVIAVQHLLRLLLGGLLLPSRR